MTKKRKLVFEAVPDERSLMVLKDGTRLEWVPSWEGALQYAPEDLKNDRNLRIWHTFRSKKFGGRRIRIELKATSKAYKGRYSLHQRADFKFTHKGELIHLYRSYLTMLCQTGFAVADRRHWVIDHKNGNTLDDRPSNLQVITQHEDSDARLQLFVTADERAVQFLRQEMQEREVTFVFRKENGEIVRRTGTLQADYISNHYTYKTSGSAYDNPRFLCYWDLGQGGWRSCYCERLIGYFEN